MPADEAHDCQALQAFALSLTAREGLGFTGVKRSSVLTWQESSVLRTPDRQELHIQPAPLETPKP